MRRPGVRGMDAVARDKLVSMFKELCETIPVLKRRRKETLKLCRKLGRVLRSVGINTIRRATTSHADRSHTVHISWRGYFYEYTSSVGCARVFDAKETAEVVSTLLRDLEAMGRENSEEQKKLDLCWESLNEFFRRMEQLNGQRADQ